MTIKQLREQKGMTWEQFAKTLGVSVSTVARWESGTCKPGIGAITSICLIFGQKTATEVMEEYHG